MGDGIKKGRSTNNSLGHLAYWMAKRCPQISDETCDKVLHREFPKRKTHDWYTIQRFGVYRGDANHSPEQLGVKTEQVANAVLKRIDGQADILRAIFRLVSRSAEKQLVSALGMRGKQQRRTSRKPAATRKTKRKASGFDFATTSAIEGVRREIRWFARTRNRPLRDRKLAKSNGKCEACGRDFSKILGGQGTRVLLVHHNRRQLSDYDARGEKQGKKTSQSCARIATCLSTLIPKSRSTSKCFEGSCVEGERSPAEEAARREPRPPGF